MPEQVEDFLRKSSTIYKRGELLKMNIKDCLVIVRGGGDLATGTIHCLHQCGFKVLVLEIGQPTTIRRQAAFSEAMYHGETVVEGVHARRVTDQDQIMQCFEAGIVPIAEDTRGQWIKALGPDVVVDAIIAKKNLGTRIEMAPLVIGLGPGFVAGADVHVVIETMRGHNLGRILTTGSALPNTGIPGVVAGFSKERVIHSPVAGVMHHVAAIGDVVKKGDTIAYVGQTPVYATLDGVLRGLLNDGLSVPEGFKIADIDPRLSEQQNCVTISDKARTIAGGVLQAILMYGPRAERKGGEPSQDPLEGEAASSPQAASDPVAESSQAPLQEEIGPSPQVASDHVAESPQAPMEGEVGSAPLAPLGSKDALLARVFPGDGETHLTALCATGGCGAKIPAGKLSEIVGRLPVKSDDELLVGFDYADDAGVYRLNDDLAIIQTLDFFPPIVDDPYTYGKIAAANALSDVYAMGGVVKTAMNIVGFPEFLDYEILGEILRGGAEKVMEAGAVLCGGHSIKDNEPKYGLSVTGVVHPQKLLANQGAKPGDVLILTKKLGVGIITAARKVELDRLNAFDEAVESMTMLNKYACEALDGCRVHACTDVTGFGFLGHLHEMLSASGVSALIYKEKLPVMTAAYEYAKDFIITCAAQRNRHYVGENVEFIDDDYALEEVLFDPQTSGGLLLACDSDDAEVLLERLKARHPWVQVIGQIMEKTEKEITVF